MPRIGSGTHHNTLGMLAFGGQLITLWRKVLGRYGTVAGAALVAEWGGELLRGRLRSHADDRTKKFPAE